VVPAQLWVPQVLAALAERTTLVEAVRKQLHPLLVPVHGRREYRLLDSTDENCHHRQVKAAGIDEPA
jgi:hypothetical protein